MNISPYAYQKMMYFIRKPVEVAGFAILSEDLKTIIDYELLYQESGVASFEFNREKMSDYIEKMSDRYSPAQCFRVFVHTHPGDCPKPSGTDWETFNSLMSSYPWFGMLIFAKDQSYYFYLKLTQGPGLETEVDLDIDWGISCQPVDFEHLENEYKEKVSIKPKVFSAIKLPESFRDQGHLPWDLKARWQNHTSNYTNIKEDRWDREAEQSSFPFESLRVESDEELEAEIMEQLEALDRVEELDSELDDDEIFENFLKNKSINEMSDEEFEFFQQYMEK